MGNPEKASRRESHKGTFLSPHRLSSRPAQGRQAISQDSVSSSLSLHVHVIYTYMLIHTTKRYISNDPAQRTWMDDGPFNHRPYLPPVMQEGRKVFAKAVCEVIETYNTPGYAVGEIIACHAGWANYALIDPTAGIPPTKVPESIKPEDYHCLDLTGQSAYFGIFKRAEASNKMKTVVVNAAAGAVGSMATQFAKNILGVERVIGVCGSDEKCRIIKEQCGVDIALNYKSPDFEAQFVAATPDYIDL